MELRKNATNAAYRSIQKTPAQSPYHSPPPVRRGHKATLTSETQATSSATPEPQLRRLQGKSSEDLQDVGLVTSETSKYYLVKTKTAWVPIMKGHLLAPDSSPLPVSTSFAEVKLKRVRILDPGCYTSYAQILDPEAVEKGPPPDTERIISPAESEDTAKQLLQHYEQLAVRLMTDVVALSRLVTDSCPAENARDFLSVEKYKLERRVKDVISELESLNTPAAQRVKQVFLNLLHNLNDRAAVTCENCHVAKYDVRLSCGHKYCSGCQHKLVQTMLSGNALAKCFLCRAELSKVDQKLVALEQYHLRVRTKDTGGGETARGKACKHARRASQGPEINYRCYVCHCCVQGGCSSPVTFSCPNCKSVTTTKSGLRPRQKD